VIELMTGEHAPGGAGGDGQKVGVGDGEFCVIRLRSRFDASVTEYTAFSTVLLPGKFVPFQLSPGEAQVAHVGRAAIIAPRCAACVIVE
jgi:hypothetical protein